MQQERVEVPTESGERRLCTEWLHLTTSRYVVTAAEEMSRQMVSHTGPISLCMLHVSTVGWTWWDWSLSLRTYLSSVLWRCWLGHLIHKNPSPIWLGYNVFGGTLNPAQSNPKSVNSILLHVNVFAAELYLNEDHGLGKLFTHMCFCYQAV